ncbi:uncharacterized protein GIQ15_04754 [Arthroderma uncinatum]|uniref:uncharacterized protein n=1 Tax=Arthroderma uncinatum TaxID=74035 RepID=UPI00144AF123|nr:uncharacterized protein GIQ15_04754 [Arthroderma uncinatum]KAF3481995.1 hypothetical protein GIQ15_04754 [Arthroderma uncinatum]
MSIDSGVAGLDNLDSRPAINTRFPRKPDIEGSTCSHASEEYYSVGSDLSSPRSSSSSIGSPRASSASSPSASQQLSSVLQLPVKSVPKHLQEARAGATKILGLYRSTLVELELNRLSTARVGLQDWIDYWHSVYSAKFAALLCQKIIIVRIHVDCVFKEASHDICDIINEVEGSLSVSKSRKEIKARMGHLRARIHRVVDERQVKASNLMEQLRCDIESIPVDIADITFDRLKKRVYGLDPDGRYHPNPNEPDAVDPQDILNATVLSYIEYRRREMAVSRMTADLEPISNGDENDGDESDGDESDGDESDGDESDGDETQEDYDDDEEQGESLDNPDGNAIPC